MKIIHFLIENKDAILTFIFALIFRRVEKPIVEKQTTKKIMDILGNENPEINVSGILDKLKNYGKK